jgi:aminoglycoside phosphotransferase (APT) family kinase protein
MGAATEGIREQTLVPWLEDHVAGLTPPVEFAFVSGGRSNLTYRVRDAHGNQYVLRRPPLKQVLATAHDMGREHRIISALAGTKVPVPAALALCDDPDINGAPFYVMGFVEGNVVRDSKTASTVLTEEARRTASESLVEVLAEIHAVDVDAVGLGDLGRREGYIERQLKRWRGQLDHATSQVPDELFDVHDQLKTMIPEQKATGIVHGDYRLDNCIVGDDGQVRAVLDWELCTLGDTLADIGQMLVYWTDPDDAQINEALVGAPTIEPGFLRRDEVAARYAERTGRDLRDLDFYVAFASWRIGCILQGVTDRYRDGAMADEGVDVDVFAERVRGMGVRAAELLS